MSEKLDLIPRKNNIRIKQQDDAYVVFNLETSGFHRITKDAFEILEKADGKTSIREIASYFAQERKLELEKLQESILAFLSDLEIRKIVTIAAAED